MRNKKVGIGNGKWGFYFLLLTFYFLLLTLFMPDYVMAGSVGRERDRMLRMPKYSLWGDITLQYEDKNTGNTSTNRFTQNYRLKFQSYVISPRIMYYTINTGFDIETGTMAGAKGITKNYGINTVFFPTKPLTFSLWASRTDGSDYETTSYGLSMAYTRRGRPRLRRPAAPSEENVNKDLNINANLNENANLNANTDEEGNANTNEKVAPEPKPRLEKKPSLSNGFFYDILPHVTVLNIDRSGSKYKSGSESTWNSAALRFLGNYRNTGYNLNFDYDAWTRDKTSHKGYGSELRTDTRLKWDFFQRFENYICYRKNDITSYDITPSLTGETKKWIYGIYANYSATLNSEAARQYSIKTDISNKTPYIYKGIDLFYRMGLGFNHSGDKDDLFANGGLHAQKRLSLNTNVHSSLSVHGGTVGSSFDFQTGINYTFRPRKGYALNIELDPKKDIIKTQTFKPQVSGWDYSIMTGYTLGISKTTGERGLEVGVAQRTNKTLVSHRADLNINVYLRMLTISSDAVFYYTDAGKSLSWNNLIYATVMRKIGVTIGTGMTVDMPEDGTKTTNYNIYNLITYLLSRNALLRLDSRYTKVMPADTTTLEVTPSLTWAWRKVFVELEVRLKTDKTGNGAETKERRILLRVTRPFNIL